MAMTRSSYRFAGINDSVYWFEARGLATYEVLTMYQRAIENNLPRPCIRADRFGNRLFIGLYNPIEYAFKIGSDYYLSIGDHTHIAVSFEIDEYVPNTVKNHIDLPKTSTYREVFHEISNELIKQKISDYTKLLDNCFDDDAIIPDDYDFFESLDDLDDDLDDELDDELEYLDDSQENPVELIYT